MKAIDPKETRERYLNARMAEHVEELLKDYECKVMRCDDRSGETDPSLIERAERANRAGADAFISIHHNAGINGGRGGGICVFAAGNASKTSLALQKAVYEETVKRTGLKGSDGQHRGKWQRQDNIRRDVCRDELGRLILGATLFNYLS